MFKKTPENQSINQSIPSEGNESITNNDLDVPPTRYIPLTASQARNFIYNDLPKSLNKVEEMKDPKAALEECKKLQNIYNSSKAKMGAALHKGVRSSMDRELAKVMKAMEAKLPPAPTPR